MRSEFVKIVVHGFKSSEKEGDIIERLLAFGFEVKDSRAIYTGMGGMIETQIMCWDELHSKSIDEISKEICVGSETRSHGGTGRAGHQRVVPSRNTKFGFRGCNPLGVPADEASECHR